MSSQSMVVPFWSPGEVEASHQRDPRAPCCRKGSGVPDGNGLWIWRRGGRALGAAARRAEGPPKRKAVPAADRGQRDDRTVGAAPHRLRRDVCRALLAWPADPGGARRTKSACPTLFAVRKGESPFAGRRILRSPASSSPTVSRSLPPARTGREFRRQPPPIKSSRSGLTRSRAERCACWTVGRSRNRIHRRLWIAPEDCRASFGPARSAPPNCARSFRISSVTPER